MEAKYIVRHSIVKYNGTLYTIENKSKPILLVPSSGGVGIELLKSSTNLEVVKYPAELAMDYLNNISK